MGEPDGGAVQRPPAVSANTPILVALLAVAVMVIGVVSYALYLERGYSALAFSQRDASYAIIDRIMRECGQP